MLTGILYVLFVLACVILIATVLLQPGKADAGALFTSNISSTAFGPRGTQTILSKITIGAAAAFMILAFLLSQPALTGNRSVLETTGSEETPAEQQSTNAANEINPAGTTNQNQAASPAAATAASNEASSAPANAAPESNQLQQPATSNSNQ